MDEKMIHDHWISLEVEDEIPNRVTLDAIHEMDDEINNPNLKTYDSFDEILDELQ